jgi:DNA (cytosine-5)-methyltransferase 1
MSKFSVLELCAGGGGQALGLELAGFDHSGVVEYEPAFCTTLRTNRPHWNVLNTDIRHLRAEDFSGSDVVAAGVPCPPFSVAGKQLGADDERDMFPAALRIVAIAKPRAVLFENVQGLASARFADYRMDIFRKLSRLGYMPRAEVLQAVDFGVPQLRPRYAIVALRPDDDPYFSMPRGTVASQFVGDVLGDLMAEGGWRGAAAWVDRAQGIAPTVVGGSKKHGGPDLGPTRAKRQWAQLGVDGNGIADAAPAEDFPESENPKLTVRMVARVQGFPDSWQFVGRKTIAYRQVGNAFPPPVAKALGESLIRCFNRRVNRERAAEGDGQFVLLEPKAVRRRIIAVSKTA